MRHRITSSVTSLQSRASVWHSRAVTASGSQIYRPKAGPWSSPYGKGFGTTHRLRRGRNGITQASVALQGHNPTNNNNKKCEKLLSNFYQISMFLYPLSEKKMLYMTVSICLSLWSLLPRVRNKRKKVSSKMYNFDQ